MEVFSVSDCSRFHLWLPTTLSYIVDDSKFQVQNRSHSSYKKRKKINLSDFEVICYFFSMLTKLYFSIIITNTKLYTNTKL